MKVVEFYTTQQRTLTREIEEAKKIQDDSHSWNRLLARSALSQTDWLRLTSLITEHTNGYTYHSVEVLEQAEAELDLKPGALVSIGGELLERNPRKLETDA